MSELIDVLRSLVQESVGALKPAELATGTVESVAPLKIKTIETQLSIPEAALIVVETLKEKTATVEGGSGSGGSVVLQKGLEAGEKVIMLRLNAGQRYLVLSRA